ncbi:MAG: DUF4911 domain-containing protein [Desulfosoma sp.]|uniref:DUF4911 domain-containing protein n=1 Tax=Desulfosoma sp. TaxID=2603217 RepID=UPI00404A0C02
MPYPETSSLSCINFYYYHKLIRNSKFKVAGCDSMNMDRCRVFEVWMDPRHIHLLTSIIEAYEGLGVVTTEDPRLAHVRIAVAPGCEGDLLTVLDHERERLGIRSFVHGVS